MSHSLQRICRESRDGFGKVELKSKFLELTFNIITRMVAGKRFYGGDVDDHASLNFWNLINETFQYTEATNPADSLQMTRYFIFCLRKGTKIPQTAHLFLHMHRLS